MRTRSENQAIQLINKIRVNWENSSIRRLFILQNKTLRDLFSWKGFITTYIIFVGLPLILQLGPLNFSTVKPDYDSMSIYSVSMKFNFGIIPFMFFWTLGMMLTLNIGIISAGLIADEVDRGTMLLLVSKPVSRIQIFLGKFLAVFIYEAILCFISIFSYAYITVGFFSGNVMHFLGMLPFLWVLFLYSLIVISLFLAISMALSSIMSRGRNVGFIMISLSIIGYLVFFSIRQNPDMYTNYHLYLFDISHHLGNVFNSLIELTNALPSSTDWQIPLNSFSGIFTEVGVDTSQGIDLGGLILVGYIHPSISFLILVGIAVILLFFGLYKLNRKEIAN